MTEDWNADDPDATKVAYDLGAWTFDQQAELASELADAEIPHAWDGTELIVPEDREVAVDVIVAAVEERLGIDDGEEITDGEAAPEPIELAEDVITTEYDLAESSDEQRDGVGAALTNAHLAFRWDGPVLLVATDDEEAVEAILDRVERGDTRPPFEALTTFFLAGERLQKQPLDAGGLAELLAALDVADPTAPPYGVEPQLWTQTCELAEELADALAAGDEPDEERAAEIAADLHDLLRPHV